MDTSVRGGQECPPHRGPSPRRSPGGAGEGASGSRSEPYEEVQALGVGEEDDDGGLVLAEGALAVG
jgi:hypothetical protein